MTVEERLERIESMLVVLVERQQVREWYSVEEFAQILGKAEFTVREWCRLGRVHAEKRLSGRGAFPAWCISHQELLRYQREGLIPFKNGPGGLG
jgi:DNA-directed RNA polymerase specialized sigma24 family protein